MCVSAVVGHRRPASLQEYVGEILQRGHGHSVSDQRCWSRYFKCRVCDGANGDLSTFMLVVVENCMQQSPLGRGQA